MKHLSEHLLPLAFGMVCIFVSACSEAPPPPAPEPVAEAPVDTLPAEPEIPQVNIGSQTWMAHNMNVEMPASYCYDDDSTNCAENGRLYSWAAAQHVCPDGWHLPTDEEWTQLIEELGGEESAVFALAKNAEGSFGAKMGGSRTIQGKYSNLGLRGTFWTATKLKKQHAWCRIVRYNEGDVLRKRANVDAAFSCRCVKDDAEAVAGS